VRRRASEPLAPSGGSRSSAGGHGPDRGPGLLLIIGEATQQGLLGDDFSVTNALLVVTTFTVIDIALGLAKQRTGWLERIVEGTPVVVFADGEPIRDRMKRARIDEGDILEAARVKQGLERLDQVKFAVLERSGGISIIPR
jgi:uncharacterized membrane protein YcaP (DUF421 family)